MTPPARRVPTPLRLVRAAALAAAVLLPAAAHAQVFGSKAIGVAPAMAQTQGGGQRWALVVGINEYSSVPGLRFARQDAQAMARALVEH